MEDSTVRWNLNQLPPTIRQSILAQHPDLAVQRGQPQKKPGSPGQNRLTEALRAAFSGRVQAEYVPLPDRRYRVDVAIPDAKLVIEINGWSNHGKSLRSFQSDHERTRVLLLAGWRVVPFTHREAMQETGRCVEIVRQLVERQIAQNLAAPRGQRV